MYGTPQVLDNYPVNRDVLDWLEDLLGTGSGHGFMVTQSRMKARTAGRPAQDKTWQAPDRSRGMWSVPRWRRARTSAVVSHRVGWLSMGPRARVEPERGIIGLHQSPPRRLSAVLVSITGLPL
jgi:hypothetical protein